MKDELKGKIMTKFVVLGPKTYSYCWIMVVMMKICNGNGKKYVIKQNLMTKKILTKKRKHIKITTKI